MTSGPASGSPGWRPGEVEVTWTGVGALDNELEILDNELEAAAETGLMTSGGTGGLPED